MNTNKLNFKAMKMNYLNLNLMKTSKFILGALFCLTLITSCSDDDDPIPVLEEELITNVTLTFVNNANTSDTVVMSSIAPDGQDGASTEIVTGDFTEGATYSLNLAITNASENPADDVLNDDSIDIVVELMGGIEKPYEVVKKALEKGKAVVTANKALLAYHRYELQEIAGDTAFEYEEAVACYNKADKITNIVTDNE